MKSGTAEQEQNGVTTPRSAARTEPTPSRLPARTRRVLSGVKKDRTIPTPKTTSVRSISTFGASYRKNSTAEPRGSRGDSPRTAEVSQEAAAARRV